MKLLTFEDVRRRLSGYLAVSGLRSGPDMSVAVPLGKLGTYNDCPVISSALGARHGAIGGVAAGGIVSRRQDLTPGVYDVWWNIAILALETATIQIAMETSAALVRYRTGFTILGSLVAPAQGHIAMEAIEQDDEITFRTDAEIIGTIAFNTVILQRLP